MKKFCVACAVLLAVAFAGAQGKRFITEKDLFRLTWIADPQLSPDGSTVAFVRVTVNEKENRYETSLFAVPSSGAESPRRLTANTRDTSPRWAPDGKRLAFVRAVEKDGKPEPGQLYLLNMDGGEAGAITEIPRGAGAPVWSPDGRFIAFTGSTGLEGQDGRDKQDGKDVKGGPYKSDVNVITRAVYRANGNPGYVDNDHHSHIFTIAVPGSDPVSGSDRGLTPIQPTQITDGEFDEGGVAWAPDNSTIC